MDRPFYPAALFAGLAPMKQALLLCAGRGERLRPLTDELPKPLVDVNGETLLGRHLRALSDAGFEQVVINLGWLGERIVEHADSGSRYGLRIVYSPEGYPTLDTGGAIAQALPHLEDTFLVVNADIWTAFDYSKAGASVLKDTDAAIGLVANPDYRASGDFTLCEGSVTNQRTPGLTYSGIACYHRRFFDHTRAGERFSIVPMLRAAADAGRLSGFPIVADWFDVGTPERLASVRAYAAKVNR
ncbi:MAG: NDP-sugar synthase [Woeseiaceae bacterium]